MTGWTRWAFGVAAYAIALVVMLPATWVDSALRSASDDRLGLAGVEGTLWSGAGRLEMRDARGRAAIAKPVAWHVQPLSLLRGRLLCELEFDPPGKRIPVTISPSRIELEGAEFDVPAGVFGLGMPRLAPLGLTGDVRIHIARLAIERHALHGDATAQWRAAGSALTRVWPLGNYELRFNSEAGPARASLRTLQGPIELDGDGSWAAGKPPVFHAAIRVPPPYREQLAPLLRLIAVERDEGRFELQAQ